MVEERINDPINLLDGSYSIMLVPSSNLASQNVVGIPRAESAVLQFSCTQDIVHIPLKSRAISFSPTLSNISKNRVLLAS